MTAIATLGFEEGQGTVQLVLNSGETFDCLTIDWANLRKDWPAPNGVMVEVDGPSVGLAAGHTLTAFVPWWNIKFIKQEITPVVAHDFAEKR